MDLTEEIDLAPRADVLKVESDPTIHEQWALHKFAFEQGEGWLPTRLRRYHKDRKINGELAEGYYDEFIPVALDTDRGMVIRKDVEERTISCPECNVPARNQGSDIVCPECGMLCNESKLTDNMIRDPKTAGRVDENGNRYND